MSHIRELILLLLYSLEVKVLRSYVIISLYQFSIACNTAFNSLPIRIHSKFIKG